MMWTGKYGGILIIKDRSSATNILIPKYDDENFDSTLKDPHYHKKILIDL